MSRSLRGRSERQPIGGGAPRRLRAALVMACGIHAGLLVAIWSSHALRPTASDAAKRPSPPNDEPWDFDMIEVPSDVRAPGDEPELAPGTAMHGPLAAAPEGAEKTPTSARPPSPMRPGSGEGNVTAPVAPVPSASAGEKWTFSPFSHSLDGARIASPEAPNGFAVHPPMNGDAPPADASPSRVGGLTEALDAEDAKRGTGRGAPVKFAVEAAARSTDAPTVGTATYDIVVDASHGSRVHLISASSNFEGWNRLSAAIQGHLAGKQVRIAPGAQGLHVVVEVEAREQFPDGLSPRSLGTKMIMTPTGPSPSYQGKVCEGHPEVVLQQPYHVGLGPPPLPGRPVVSLVIKGKCSPENAGVPATRVVSSRIKSEMRL